MRIVVTGPIGTIGLVIFLIVLLVILYWIIRIAVREAILAAWRIRNRAEKEARDDKAQGW